MLVPMHPTDLRIGFETQDYNVTEGASAVVEVCIAVMEPPSVTFPPTAIFLRTMDDSATGGKNNCL